MRKLRENEEIKSKWREYAEMNGNGERMRKWSARQNEREKEFHLYISPFLSQYIELCHFLSQNVKIRQKN